MEPAAADGPLLFPVKVCRQVGNLVSRSSNRPLSHRQILTVPLWERAVQARDTDAHSFVRVSWQVENVHSGLMLGFQLLTLRELPALQAYQTLARSLFAEISHGNLAAEQVVRTAEHRFALGGLQMIIRLGNCRGGKHAFSLVEVMVAVFVVAVLFTALFTGLSQGIAMSASASERLRANQIALERIEGLRLVKWSDLSNTNLVPLTFTNKYYPSAAGQAQGISYIGRVTIGNPGLGTSYNDGMRKITVTLSWTSGTTARTETLTTYVSRNGLQNYVYYN
jgi:prepilin-type N-terminal cleavage/methylation domain-containing protein